MKFLFMTFSKLAQTYLSFYYTREIYTQANLLKLVNVTFIDGFINQKSF